MTLQISILFTNGRTIEKSDGGGGGGGREALGEKNKKKIRATENVREKINAKKIPKKKFIL